MNTNSPSAGSQPTVLAPADQVQALRSASAPASTRITPELLQLREEGYAVLKNTFCPAHIQKLTERVEEIWRMEAESGAKLTYREEGVRRIENLEIKGDIFLATMMQPQIIKAGNDLVGEPVRLSMLKARDPLPHNPRQAYHRDCPGLGLPDAKGYYSYTVLVPLDDFTPKNGGTVLIPGSQKWTSPLGLKDATQAHPDEIIVCAQKGDAILLNGHTWHAGATNKSEESRRTILVHFYADRIERTGRFRPALTAEQQSRLSQSTLAVLGL